MARYQRNFYREIFLNTLSDVVFKIFVNFLFYFFVCMSGGQFNLVVLVLKPITPNLVSYLFPYALVIIILLKGIILSLPYNSRRTRYHSYRPTP